jgi:hypothetical protein
MKDLKDTYRVQIAEYAAANKIANEPAFNGWVHTVLQKQNCIVANKVKQYWQITHKFGIRVPKNMRMNTHFQTRLNASYNDNNSAI